MGSVWAEMGLAIAAPALLILLMPRRWLGRTILLWIVSPLIVYVAVLLWETFTRPSGGYGLGNAVYGFMLLSSILALPWLIGCALGFAIGFGLRRLFRRSAPLPPPPATPQPKPPILRLSPDGTIRVEVEAVEWGSSRWVYSPRVIDVPTGRVVLDLWNTDWDATIDFPGPRRVELGLRRYHEGGGLSAELDLERGTYRVVSEHGHDGPRAEEPLSGIVAGLEEAARRTVVANGWMAQPAIIPPKPWAAWRIGLVIFVGAFVAIGAAAYLTERYKAENRKPPVLDTVPRLEPPPIRR